MLLTRTARALGLLPKDWMAIWENVPPSGNASPESPPVGNAAGEAPGVLPAIPPAIEPEADPGLFELTPETKAEIDMRIADWDLIDQQHLALLCAQLVFKAIKRGGDGLFVECGGEMAMENIEAALDAFRKARES